MTDTVITLDFLYKLPEQGFDSLDTVLSKQFCSVLNWRIKLIFADGHIGVFLVCDGDEDKTYSWSCKVGFSFEYLLLLIRLLLP